VYQPVGQRTVVLVEIDERVERWARAERAGGSSGFAHLVRYY